MKPIGTKKVKEFDFPVASRAVEKRRGERDMKQTQPEHEWTTVEGAPEWRVRRCSHPDMVSFKLDRLDLTFSLVLDWSIATHMGIKLDDESVTIPRAAIDAARDLLGIPHPQLVEFNGWGDNVKRYEEDADNG